MTRASCVLGRQDVAREALVVEQLEERGERLRVAVVRRRREEELVLEVRREQTDEARAQALDGVLADGGRDVVGLVDDQQVEACAGTSACGGSTSRSRRTPSPCFAQSMEAMSRGNERPRVGVEPALAAQTLDVTRCRRSGTRARTSRAISTRHFSCSDDGHSTRTVRARCRRSSSWTTSPASMVFPRPTSSAISRLVRAMSIARTSGSSW